MLLQNNPTILKLKSDDGRSGWVKVSLKYIPIQMQLDPSESINNMGKLRVDVLDGAELPSADRNGKSDPYCKFELNGQDVFKSKVIKKTLSPAWNEFFEVNVPSRTAAKFRCNIYDYDFADKPDYLGGTDVRLDELEPFKGYEQTYKLDGKSGHVRIRLLFRPDYVTRTRQGTSNFAGTFGAPTRIVTGVAGAPIKGGVAVAGAVGHGVGKSASFVRRGIFGKKEREAANGTVETLEVPSQTGSDNGGTSRSASFRKTSNLEDSPDIKGGAVPIPSIETPTHSRSKSIGASSVHSAVPAAAGGGTASFTVVGAEGFSSSADLYVTITQIAPREKSVGKTKHFKSSSSQWKFDETFKFSCTADAQFKVEVKGQRTFGSDDVLGEHAYFVDETGTEAPKQLSIGDGTVTLKSHFQQADSASLMDSPRPSSVRRSILLKRDSRAGGSRETTPNP